VSEALAGQSIRRRFAAIAAATPSTRDRYVDFLRAASIVVVVLGHWMQAIITRTDGRIVVYGAVGVTSGLWLLTWIIQVMPLFFFVGGFSNYVGLHGGAAGGRSVNEFVATRLRRLGAPFIVFAAVWLVVQLLLHVMDVGGAGWLRGFLPGNIPFGPLWFLVYLVVTLTSPFSTRLHDRFGALVPALLGVVVIAVDLLAFGAGIPGIRWVNVAAVWLLVHQLGYFYADGSLGRLTRTQLVTSTVAGLTVMIILTNIGVYPRSMVGTDAVYFALKPIERISNMNPPTAVILAHSIWLIGVSMLARDRVTRWLKGVVAWDATVILNLSIMTIFLWHMTAYAVVILLAWPLGLGQEPESTFRWWLERPFWVTIPAVVLAVLVRVFGRFERGPQGPRRSRVQA
jgi:fucose 4-O-acetylase-like acetyltransferase